MEMLKVMVVSRPSPLLPLPLIYLLQPSKCVCPYEFQRMVGKVVGCIEWNLLVAYMKLNLRYGFTFSLAWEPIIFVILGVRSMSKRMQ